MYTVYIHIFVERIQGRRNEEFSLEFSLSLKKENARRQIEEKERK